jgi:hypothetical protein
MHQFLFGAAAGVSFGVFCPALARKVKALFVKDASAAKAAVTTAVEKKL